MIKANISIIQQHHVKVFTSRYICFNDSIDDRGYLENGLDTISLLEKSHFRFVKFNVIRIEGNKEVLHIEENGNRET